MLLYYNVINAFINSEFAYQFLKFIYSEKATKLCEISTVDLTVTTWDKSTVEISQNCLAFSEYMNFKQLVEVWGLEIDRLKNFKNFNNPHKTKCWDPKTISFLKYTLSKFFHSMIWSLPCLLIFYSKALPSYGQDN